MTVAKMLTKRKMLSIVLAIPLFFITYNIVSARRGHDTRKNGKLVVDFNIDLGDPIFDFDDFKPGDCKEHTITVKNGYDQDKKIYTKSVKKKDQENISRVLSISIGDESSILYGENPNKTLNDFFHDGKHKGIFLSKLAADEETDYTILVCFEEDAGNKYQKKETKFDIIVYTNYTHEDPEDPPEDEIPEECLELDTTRTIYGTEKGDYIRGTNQSEIIVAKGGGDFIIGGGGNDCIVGGSEGDSIIAGSGNDVVFGGSGSDKISGGLGNDKLYGNEGSDVLTGGFGNDYLNGGPGNDWLTGQFGTDTCENGENVHMCEN